MNKLRLLGWAMFLGSLSCGEANEDIPWDVGPGTPNQVLSPGIKVEDKSTEKVEEIMTILKKDQGMKAADFLERYKIDFPGSISFVPSSADNIQLIQNSSLALTANETNALDANAFVIAKSTEFPSFVHGYKTIYLEDLPLFVSADSVLEAVHRSYDDILMSIELEVLIPTLRQLLTSMRENQAQGLQGFKGKTKSDVDFYLSVALQLLTNAAIDPGAADSTAVNAFVQKAIMASGSEALVLFGAKREIDFSQFKPRGHYQDNGELENYFRAMIWLGRIDFRMLEADIENTLVFHRDQFDLAVALRTTMDTQDYTNWKKIHDTIGAFVGEPDSMIVDELDELMASLNIADAATLGKTSNEAIADLIQKKGYGEQRISSHIMKGGIYGQTQTLSSIFMLFGQRYVLDSHVFSNVVFDRVNGGETKRMMPDPLDIAFAALGNDYASTLLADELSSYEYSYDLHTMRTLADMHDEDYWNKNLYNLWMGALRTLSPNRALEPELLPEVARTENWSKRLLNTQLSSWAELRHDTILYAKQSYSAQAGCEFPDAYVEPNPEFFLAIAEYAARGSAMIAELELSTTEIADYFRRTEEINRMLADMANYQKLGTPYTPEMLAFINQSVMTLDGCDGPVDATGWYADLYFRSPRSIDFDPTIADVHTQPTDEFGYPVGKVLHVGTGNVRLMVTTIETCDGPRAYVGLASSYFQTITENYKRLDDEQWAEKVQRGDVDDPDWMVDVAVE